ncbi:MAG: N-6 DNA methylase, partial [Gammaproteobacteria bacterium]|nr:N-6 DNA methylase [Gammaproteobacteria bacterium]
MLDADTKSRIDTARDILVGIVPDPKSQVEQITIALIYKFMDDMDAESEELGGNRKFFAGEFVQYGWPKLVRSGLGGHEVLNLYSDAITRMPENPGIPPLFRDIFKNAFLPYRNPETLRAFLKIIDEFEYDHSERLGDAFQYLLSVLGSQGDAGQFRTPRHIIDFIVGIIDPKKDETILDPACGTAGFLISSYKHILKSNTDEKGHSTLTPDEKGKLAANFKGYDISPDMVRLSLVNLYLHGFVAPQVHEYDTLTSEDRWNDYADVVLANPPFMSPRGGIRPHNRFSVKSKRSEVLFVDYMAEHLTPNGRAGIIVPEGIVFKSQNAYKQLRKMLVEEYLVAVISLPAGVFNPYSGVKTSILLLDKALARRRDNIGFFKVENDGFDLGAQRREIDQNDLPAIRQATIEYLNMDGQDKDSPESMFNILAEQGSVQIVAKKRIATDGEYNLSGERYREVSEQTKNCPWVKLEEIADVFVDGDWIESKDQSDSGIRLIQTGNIGNGKYLDKPQNARFISEETFKRLNCTEVFPGDVLVSRLPDPVGRACIAPFLNTRQITAVDCTIIRFNKHSLLPELFVAITKSELYYRNIEGYLTGATRPRISRSNLGKVKIPLPPLEIQREIVAKIDGYQKVIDGAQAVVENYRPHITIDPDWPMVTFANAPFEMIDGDRGKNYPKKEDFSLLGHCIFLNTKNVLSDGFDFDEIEYITEEKDKALRKGKLRRGDVVLTTRGTIGNTGYYNSSVPFDHIRINSGMLIFRPDENELSGNYLFHFFQSQNFREQREAIVSGAAQPQLPIRSLNEAKLPIPTLQTQLTIVTEIEAEQALAKLRLIPTRHERAPAVLRSRLDYGYSRAGGGEGLRPHGNRS